MIRQTDQDCSARTRLSIANAKIGLHLQSPDLWWTCLTQAGLISSFFSFSETRFLSDGCVWQNSCPTETGFPRVELKIINPQQAIALLMLPCLVLQMARSSSRNRTGSASLGPSNASLIGLRQQPASSPRACIRQQGDGCRPTSLVPSHRSSRLSSILSRLPIANSLSQPQLPLVHPLSRPDAASQQTFPPLQPSGTLEASDPAPSETQEPSALEPVQLASSLGYPDRQHWSSGHGVVSFPAGASQGSAEESEEGAESTQPGDAERQACRDQRAKQRQREVEISKLILEKVQQQHRCRQSSTLLEKLHHKLAGANADVARPPSISTAEAVDCMLQSMRHKHFAS